MPVDTQILPTVYSFRPNRQTLGGTAYLILRQDAETGKPANVLVDCPAIAPSDLDEIERLGGVKWLVLTHRTAMGPPAASTGPAAQLQERFGSEVIVQEQEAYLLPHLAVTSFGDSLLLTPDLQLIWTPGHTPGSSCLFYAKEGGVLFTGRHLLPDGEGGVAPLHQPKTFHWPRQLRSTLALRDRISAPAPAWICPGANVGQLRGQKMVGGARDQLECLARTFVPAALSSFPTAS
jgi:glyoxylase-like metal-dependent hydrolase (beta-lactamase superfamily II)